MIVSEFLQGLRHQHHTYLTLPSSRGHRDGRRAGSEAEVVVEAGAARGQLVAAVATPCTVAEPDVVRRREAVRVRGIEARRAPGVHRARTPADVEDSGAAVGDRGVLRRARRKRVDRLAYEGELCVGVGDPVHHLLVRHEICRRLCRELVSIVQG